jgi:hypothetical protein
MASLVFLKLTVGVNLLRYASAKYAQMRQREQMNSEWEHAAADSKRLDTVSVERRIEKIELNLVD